MSTFDDIEGWFAPRVVQPIKTKSNAAGLRRALQASNNSASRSANQSATSIIKGIVTKRPEVMVKITGAKTIAGKKTNAGKGMKPIKNHLDYISRNGEVTLENQDKERIDGREAIRDLRDEWRGDGIPETSSRREAINVVLSMPPGTSAQAVHDAAREFAAQEFAGHKYVFALHTDEKHPHVHLCVMATDAQGRRLHPRKEHLARWRIEFAAKMREQGVDASATKRIQRLKHRKPEAFVLRQMRMEAEGKFKPGRTPRDRPMPEVYQQQTHELVKSLEAGQRPANPHEAHVARSKAAAAAALNRFAEDLAKAGQVTLARDLRQFTNERSRDLTSKSQAAYQTALDRMLHRAAEPEQPFIPKDLNARPDYSRVSAERQRRLNRAAAVYQSDLAATRGQGSPRPVSGLRNVPRIHVVQDARTTAVLLHTDARNRVGQGDTTGDGLRRPGTGIGGPAGPGLGVEERRQVDASSTPAGKGRDSSRDR